MKRTGLILTLFLISFVFTQCRNRCNDGASCCGLELDNPEGVSSFGTVFDGRDEWDLKILMEAKFNYAKVTPRFSLINSAYACSPVYTYSLNPFLDSIRVSSDPLYNENLLEAQLIFDNQAELSILEFNNYENRKLEVFNTTFFEFSVSDKPAQSDSFIFSFYYYKNGSIIDSSSTQKFYIRNE